MRYFNNRIDIECGLNINYEYLLKPRLNNIVVRYPKISGDFADFAFFFL